MNMNVPALRFPEFEGEWESAELGSQIDLLTGHPFKSSEYSEHPENIRLLRGDNVVPNAIRWDNARLWRRDQCDGLERYQLEESDFVIALDRTWVKAGVKAAAIERKDLPCLLVQRVARVRAIESSDQGFLKAIFQSHRFELMTKTSKTEGVVPHISPKDIRDFQVCFPSLPEQKKIAAFLGVVDAKIAALRERRDGLTRYKRGLMQALFSQTLRFTRSDGPAFPDWEEKRLGEVFGFSKGSGLSKADLTPDGHFKCIHYGQLFTDFAEVILETSKRTNVQGCPIGKVGDILTPASDVTPDGLAKASTLRVPDVRLGGDIIVWRPKEACVSEFFSYFVAANKKMMMRIVTGTTVKHIYSKDIGKLMVPIPHPDEQAKIAEALSAMDAKIAALGDQVSRIEAFKKGLLQQMFV